MTNSGINLKLKQLLGKREGSLMSLEREGGEQIQPHNRESVVHVEQGHRWAL